MKHSALLVILLSVVTVDQSRAAEYEATARVVNVTPRMETSNVPHQECTTDAPVATGDHSNVGAILGGLTGAILGAQVGKGNGRVAAAAVAAGTGAIVGDRLDNGSTQPVQHCRTVYEVQQRPAGYMVTYDYQGQTMTDYLARDPGATVRVHVHVQALN
jgi:uncharacterized protein YcfJ